MPPRSRIFERRDEYEEDEDSTSVQGLLPFQRETCVQTQGDKPHKRVRSKAAIFKDIRKTLLRIHVEPQNHSKIT